MKLVRTLVLALVVLVVLLVVIGLFLPSSARVERTVVVDAPPCSVFALVNGLATFNRWSPWYDLDPETEYTYEGPELGVGARMEWVSQDPRVGRGSQEIIASEPCRLVRTAFDFGEQGTAVAELDMEPVDGGTRVIWRIETPFGDNLVARWFGVLAFERAIGADFERGLAGLQRAAEALPREDFSDLEIERVELEPIAVAVAPGATGGDRRPMAEALAEAFGRVKGALARYGLEMDGAPIAIARSWGEQGSQFDAAVPVDGDLDREVPAEAGFELDATPGGSSVRTTHVGPYQELPTVHAKLLAYIAAHGMRVDGDPWEQYVVQPPEVEDPARAETVVVYPVEGPVPPEQEPGA